MKGMIIAVSEEELNTMLENNDPTLIQRGSRVEKIDEDPGGDVTPLGTRGTVLGGKRISDTDHMIGKVPEKFKDAKAIYIIRWDGSAFPMTASMDMKIKEVNE